MALAVKVTGDPSARMSLTSDWMHTNEYRVYIPDWPTNVKLAPMEQVQRPKETLARFMHLVTTGSFKFKVATFAEWEDRYAAYRAKTPLRIRSRADKGERRPDIHRRKRLRVPPSKPASPEFVDEEMEAQVEAEVARLRAKLGVRAGGAVEALVD